jgi:hypothetical protein
MSFRIWNYLKVVSMNRKDTNILASVDVDVYHDDRLGVHHF